MVNSRTFITIGFIGILFAACQSPKDPSTAAGSTELQPLAYDSLLATELKADKIGMAQYVIAFLKRGPNRPTDSLARVELQKAHMENIGRMAKEGKLILAGPFMDDGELRGIYVFDVKTVEEAKLLTETDPAVQYGSLVMELHPWYGSAALRKVNEIHDKISQK